MNEEQEELFYNLCQSYRHAIDGTNTQVTFEALIAFVEEYKASSDE